MQNKDVVIAVNQTKINFANQLMNEVLKSLREDYNLSRSEDLELTEDVIQVVSRLHKAVSK